MDIIIRDVEEKDGRYKIKSKGGYYWIDKDSAEIVKSEHAFGQWTDKKPLEGTYLVELEKETLGTVFHVATYRKSVNIIGGRFDFDMPKVIKWMPLPKP